MPELPYDIIVQIVEELKLLNGSQYEHGRRYVTKRSDWRPLKFSPLATLSKTWNIAAEAETLQTLHVFSDDIPNYLRGGPITTTRFKQMMSRDPERRRQIPRRIVYYASNRSLLDSDEAKTGEGQEANNRTFSASVRDFWEVLEDWPTLPDHRCRELEIRHIAIADGLHLRSIYSDRHAAFVTRDPFGSAKTNKDGVYINLLGGPLPRLRCISDFKMPDQTRLWPPLLRDILNSIEGLREAGCLSLRYPDAADLTLWKEYHDELNTTITLLPDTVTAFEANFNYIPRRLAHRPSHTSPTLDRLCVTLRDLSTQLRRLHLDEICITPALFWPADAADEPNATQLLPPYWPHLEELSLQFAPIDPHGIWYAWNREDNGPSRSMAIHRRERRPSDADDDDNDDGHNGWLDSPGIERPVDAVIAAAGRAARRMPRLRSMVLDMHAGRDGDEVVKLALNVYREEGGQMGGGAGGAGGDGGEGGAEFRLMWECMPPVLWSDEAVAAWGVEEHAAEFREGNEGWGSADVVVRW